MKTARAFAAGLLIAAAIHATPGHASAPIPPYTQSSATIYRLHHDGAIYTSVVLTPLTAACSQHCYYALAVLSSRMAWTAYACTGVYGNRLVGAWQVLQTGPYSYLIHAGRLGGSLGCQDVIYLLDTNLGTLRSLPG